MRTGGTPLNGSTVPGDDNFAATVAFASFTSWKKFSFILLRLMGGGIARG